MNNKKNTLYDEWKSEFRKLDNEIDYALTVFLQNRTCKCKNDECKHFKIERKAKFGKQINKLYNKKLTIGLSTITEVMNQN